MAIIAFLLSTLCTASALIRDIDITPASRIGDLQLPLVESCDCSNNTHRWNSFNSSCFDEESGPVPLTTSSKPNIFARAISNFVGLHRRDGLCSANETTCWVLNCCQPGETCGAINVGCQVSWSTIYSTTITTLWSTVTSWVLPTTSTVDYTTVTVNTTTYITTFNDITLPGAGLDQVIETDVVRTSTLVLSAYTPPAVTTTETITQYEGQPSATIVPRLAARETGNLLPRAEIPRRSAGTSYTTWTVFVTTFFTTSTTATISNSLVEITATLTISSAATRNQTHYETPTGFTTSTMTVTSTSTSYAYGTVDTPTQVYYVTTVPSPVIAGITPSGTEEQSAASSEAVSSPAQGGRKISPGAIAGIVIGVLFALALLALVIGVVFCGFKRRHGSSVASSSRDSFNDPPSPPAAPSPKPAMATISQSEIMIPGRSGGGSQSPVSPMSELFFSGLNMTDDSKYHGAGAGVNNGIILGSGSGSRHSRRGSRGSVVSTILPVPEEDEDADQISPVNAPGSSKRRTSTDRTWGRGYGGRGGYNNTATSAGGSKSREYGGRAEETESPTNPAFRGVITSAYNEGDLVPPHARDHGFRFN
ncbi:hypothetical protein H072_11300 [Dactylellina haptotyla CBS 200.50]|uniref:Mid2 domain-containing protein n=1 Tax=Dactylellina haptotyla (strain CBS 200.50) TaxID=1284197 RepID=S8A2F9_DACHA|nr:hypothetical protein H072_11300 [Dactylellina haptotyla CBS 200.50]